MKVVEQVKYRRLCCTICGSVYFFSEDWCERATKYGASWKCPNGHGQWFGESEETKLRRDRDRAVQEQARLAEELAAAELAKDKAMREMRRTKKRAAAALCPCCNRHFSNVEAHMKKAHPDVVKLPERKLPV